MPFYAYGQLYEFGRNIKLCVPYRILVDIKIVLGKLNFSFYAIC